MFQLMENYSTLAEWSNALDLRSSLFGGAGSNPAGTTWIIISNIILIYMIYKLKN